ncbi:DUF411 domain-containing protein [Teredinibacter sp. KSP-S5-2]|uniref:DUF411 domain-containing protein n=1 Tax=Teredinibacter sp. KSP-S5-2 TaxID=3034506 RepID=UPI002934378F|nr:DUF411 domain-containing protein [Teredinibacter sp. KSP-S5-2]WNO11141.1 DUF411 domain-containing protein [Teredinibacter sp. KSP-S5-2]
MFIRKEVKPMTWLGFVILIIGMASVVTISIISSSPEAGKSEDGTQITDITVYKSPTCGCCELWINHLKDAGFTVGTHHPQDLNLFKSEQGVSSDLWSCHTAITQSGYIFEGHIPAKFIRQFLANVPEHAKGLAVPNMPMGSPGMEYGDTFSAYTIYQINTDGSTKVYAEIHAAKDQY